MQKRKIPRTEQWGMLIFSSCADEEKTKKTEKQGDNKKAEELVSQSKW